MNPVPLTLTTRPEALVSTAEPPWFHVLDGAAPMVLVMAGSLLFEVDPSLAELLAAGDPSAEAELARSVDGRTDELEGLGPLPRPRAISLNVAQSCNLSCNYCYADEGRFGGTPVHMSVTVARRAIDDLVAGAHPGERVTVGFIGGEPLLGRAVVHDAVRHATDRAAESGVVVGFSITTNATVIDAADLDLFRSHPFAVTVSLDGSEATHDRHRSGRNGSGSWRRAVDRIRPLLEEPGLSHVSARATVTRDDLDIAGRVAALGAVGFREIGVSPARTGPDASLLIQPSDWNAYLTSMIDAGEDELARLRGETGIRRWRFSNLSSALTEIHRGTCRPLPCGAAYGYVSVDAGGSYATCHRTIGDPRFALGGPGALSDAARRTFLEERLVDKQEPCRSCWARYLCGGGCHAEVIESGRHGCDMIRGWLEQCLMWYPQAQSTFPELFSQMEQVSP
ncbi:SPASM domain-containing protein [Nocardioides immobilis]|uniref:SPASM domain-containing protein n=1 Tax=Nocardioides immobilis TaxID=2049295 RepID=A0A417XYE8_9ACTN|nr:radical SAM protein [Nocardioides immobilis]RHW25389.1 SPASM domain-containing protein [Nocardioides immobilis]